MKLVPSRPVRRLLAGLTPIALICAALPLMAPTCGGFAPGVKTFSRGSLIIPMDVCYQCTTDGDSATTSPTSCGQTGYQTPTGPGFNPTRKTCPQATAAGDVVKAYGLAYQLIRGGVPVYWVIKSTKQYLDDYDLTIHYGGGAPVYLYNWSNGTKGSPPTTAADINYMGSAFVVDGQDFARANAIMQGNVDPTCTTACETNRTRFGVVKVHVSDVAFQGDVARTMAGGWNAGGAIAPKLALLDVASGTSNGTGQVKNSEVVISGYLVQAGLDFPNAAGTSAANSHGQIYDRLVMDDFRPRNPDGSFCTTACDWTTTKLYQNGYQILWVPHWYGAGSCSNVSSCSSTQYTDAQVALVLQTIGSFVTIGKKDLFAECAGLGTFDGVTGDSNYSPAGDIANAQASYTRFHSTTGMTINGSTLGTPKYDNPTTNFASPLLQLGDYPFIAKSGAIDSYHPVAAYVAADTAVTPEVPRLIAGAGTSSVWDYFTVRHSHPAHGTVAYLSGHSYSGTDGYAYQTAGTRLVLNTLFNLGASCVATGTACSTGALGVCGVGTMQCDSGGNQVCVASATATTELCNGLDDDCDGLVDEGIEQACYTGPDTSKDVSGNPRPLCRGGVQQCTRLADGSYGYGTCVGEVLPTTEICDGADNDCDGTTDEGLSKSCYTGPSSTLDPSSGLPMGLCHAGTQTCTGGAWGTCTGEQLPALRECSIDTNAGDTFDNNCNGLVDEGCGCNASVTPTQVCYSGPAGTQGVGKCQAGVQSCTSGAWSTCRVCTAAEAALPPAERALLDCQILPAAKNCASAEDDDCNGTIDSAEPACVVCVTQFCYTGPSGTLPAYPAVPSVPDAPLDPDEKNVCRRGTRACADGVYGDCLGETLPSAEICDGLDNDCDGTVDEGPPPCGAGLACNNGVCVATVCGAEQRCPQGYVCTSGACVPVSDCCLVPLDTNGNCPGATGTCPVGEVCRSGTCVNPCEPDPCGTGTYCTGGVCTGGACYTSGCPTGQLCRNGACTADLCSGVSCPSGTFCREGDCVQACAYVSCLEGQICGEDGFCKGDPCGAMSCGAGWTCVEGQCTQNQCTTVDCGADKICRLYRASGVWTPICIDDPCAGVACPTGFCLPREAIDCATKPCVRAQCFAAGNLTGEGTVAPLKTGCGCGSGAPSPLALLLGLALLPLARRRRAPRAGALALLLAAGGALALAGCEKTTGTDPATCTQSCNPGDIVAPWIGSVSPPDGLKGSPEPVTVTLTGARFEAGATLRVWPAGAVTVTSVTVDDVNQRITAKLDLATAERETYLLRVVNPDNVISNYDAFDAVYGTPTLTSITPTSATAPAVVTVTATGSNFTAASQCRVMAGTYILSLPTTLVATTPAGTTLECTLDSSKIPPGTTQLWVVNEGGLASAQKPFEVAAPLGVTALSPPALPAICSNPTACTLSAVNQVVTVYGSGFAATGCVVKADGSIPPTTARTTTFIDSTRLQATINLTGISTASLPFDLFVQVTCPALPSGTATMPATPIVLPVVAPTSTMQVDSLSPQTAYQGTANVQLALSGSSLPTAPAEAQVQILPPSGPNAGVWQTLTSAGGGSVVTGTLDLSNTTNWPAGDYQVRLYFPTQGTYSVTFTLRVLSNVPTLWSFTSSPSAQQQGTNVTVTASGTTFFSGVKLRLISPTGTRIAPTPDTTTFTANPPGTASGTLAATFSLSGLDTGLYQLVAFNTSSGDSNPLSFTVAPGAPVLTSITPSSVTQSSLPAIEAITLAGQNFAKPDASGVGGSMIFIRNTVLGVSPMTIPTASVTVVNSTTIQVAFDKREAIPATTCNPADVSDTTNAYRVKVVNPGTTTMSSLEKGFCLLP